MNRKISCLFVILTGIFLAATIQTVRAQPGALNLSGCNQNNEHIGAGKTDKGLDCRSIFTPKIANGSCFVFDGVTKWQFRSESCIEPDAAKQVDIFCKKDAVCLIAKRNCFKNKKDLGECGVNKTSDNTASTDDSELSPTPSAESNDTRKNIQVIKVTIQNQEVNLDNPHRTLRLPGREGVAGRYPLPITIEYSDGTVDYLSYWVNYIPTNPVCETDEEFSEFAGCNPNVCGKEYWRCPTTGQTKEFDTPNDGDCVKEAYNPSCANPPVQEEKSPQQTKEENCEWRQDPYGECDWDRKQVYDYKTKYCNGEFTGEVKRFNYHYVTGQCGYSTADPPQSGASSNDCPSPYPQCGGTAGLEDYPRTDTIWVIPVCDNNGNIIDYKKDNLGNKGECS